MKINKYQALLAVLFLFLPAIIYSQITSPYSRYGIGEINTNSFGRNNAMGGVGIGMRSSGYLNNLNPASYSSMDSMSFLSDIGLTGKLQVLSLNSAATQHSKIDFNHFAFGFPIAKFLFTSIGLRPAAINNYHLKNNLSDEGRSGFYEYRGRGNLSSLYGGFGIKLTQSLSLGTQINYWFGETWNTNITGFLSEGDNYAGSKTTLRVNDVFFDFGVQYIFNIKNNKLTLGGVFTPKTALNGNTSFVSGTGNSITSDGFIAIATGDTLTFNDDKTPRNLPMGFGVGASYNINNKITLAADYSTKRWADISLNDKNMMGAAYLGETANTNNYSLGLEWIPNQRTGVKYFERVNYRVGLRYTDDYLKIDGAQLRDMAVSFGLGLPLRRTNTSINLSFEIGQKEAPGKNVFKETYGKFLVSFSLHEYWFMKNKIH
ncbi:MAG: hypothetical protein LBV41_02615 [Cytophagaceae bacterium]|jgi:uncharacterized protein (UPF0303 family)|nr:hypothetical protein [Cytophagaceae bacterium]